MRKARFTEEQMVAIMREADRDPVSAVAKRHGISEQTIYTWRKRFGGLQANDVKRLRQLEGGERAAEEAGGRARSRDRGDEGSRCKKLVSVPARRRQVAYGREHGLSARRDCTLFSVARSALSYQSRKAAKDAPRDRADEGAVGAVSALRLSAHPHLPRTRWPPHEPSPGASAVAGRRAASPAQAAEEAGRRRPSATASPVRAEPGVVLRLRLRLLRQRSAAQVPDRDGRVHQGGLGDRCRRPHPLCPRHRGAVAPGERARRPEFPAQRQRAGIRIQRAAVLDRLARHRYGVDRAGKPWQNGITESFNGKFRDECLSLEWFRSRAEAKVIIEAWRRHFNEVRPHSSLGYLTPNEFVAQGATPAPRQATGRDAAVLGAFAPRPVAQPSRRGQMQPAREAVSS